MHHVKITQIGLVRQIAGPGKRKEKRSNWLTGQNKINPTTSERETDLRVARPSLLCVYGKEPLVFRDAR